MYYLMNYILIGLIVTIIRECQWFGACVKISKLKGVNLLDGKDVLYDLMLMPLAILLWPIVLWAICRDMFND